MIRPQCGPTHFACTLYQQKTNGIMLQYILLCSYNQLSVLDKIANNSTVAIPNNITNVCICMDIIVNIMEKHVHSILAKKTEEKEQKETTEYPT